MEIIGSKVYSKYTGVEGIITEIKGRKIRASFCYGGEVYLKTDELDMDDSLRAEIRSAMYKSRKHKSVQ